MINFSIRVLVLLFFTQIVHSQAVNTSLVKNYINYAFNTKEQLFLHTHKDIFLVNETIYFSGFVKTVQGIRSSSTVQVSLYNSESKLIESSFHPVENQSYYGNFLLKVPPGKYILTASTIQKTGTSFSNTIIQPLIVNQFASKQLQTKNDLFPELYVQPEGGELITGFSNTIGFYLSTVNQSNDIIKRVTLKDSSGKIQLDSIPLIGQNFGSFKLSPKPDESYELVIRMESGSVIWKKLPLPVVKETYFTTNTLLNDKLLISYAFSNTFLNTTTVIDKDITIAIHNYDGINITKAQLNKSKGAIAIPKSNLHSQVNIISIFDKNQEVLYERFVYNHTSDNNNLLSVSLKSKSLDSISAIVTSQKELRHLNFSVAPILDKQKNQIPVYSQLLSGYGKNILLNDRFLHSKSSRKKEAQIDILCISLGKSDINWDKIKNGTYENTKKQVSNFRLEGQLETNPTNKETTITLYQKSIGNIYTTTINEKGSFYIEDVYLLKNEQIYYDLNPTISENNSVTFDITPKIVASPTLDPIIYNNYKNWLVSQKDTKEVIPFNVTSDQEVLDEVILTKKRNKTIFTRNPALSEGIYDAKKIDEVLIRKFPKVSQYIRTLGFRVMADERSGGFFVSGKSLFDSPPIVYIDGFINRGSIQDRLLSAIDEIYFEHTGFEGSNGGTLYIYTQENGRYQVEKKLGKAIAYEGFTKKEPFFIDMSKIPTVVHWTPTFTSFSTPNTITFPNFDRKKFILRAHIIDSKGNFRIEEHRIELKSNE